MPVVFHDATLDRLTHESGPISARDVVGRTRWQLEGARAGAAQKSLLQRAAALSGRTLSEFVVASATR